MKVVACFFALQYFATLKDSFISLFVLLTTANYPDVMMPAYDTSYAAAIFFIVYIGLELFIFMNLVSGDLYDVLLISSYLHF